MTFIAHLLAEYHFGLRLTGGILLCIIGIRTFFEDPEDCAGVNRTGRVFAGLYTSTFFLTLTNPATILSFGAVFAAFGLAGARGSVQSAATLGIFSLFKNRIGQQQVQWINYTAGIVIAGSGVLALLTLAI
jgi:threonine/homoserine/homoserine lactone efflux protein